MDIHGSYEFEATNEDDNTILDFALAYDFIIANVLFKKRYEHLITYKNGYNKTHIDYFLIRKIDRLYYRDYKVIPSESLSTRHCLLILNFKMKGQSMKNIVYYCSRIRWRHLKNSN